MTDESVPLEEEVEAATEAGRTFTERVSVTGSDLIETVQSLLREATVRKITVQDKDGRNLIEIPLYAGVAGALILGWTTVLALIAAWFAQVSILIERDRGFDTGEPTVVGQAVSRAADSASSAASQVVGTLSSFLGTASRGAGDAARRLADSLETRLGEMSARGDQTAAQVGEMADETAVKVGEAADAAAEKVSDAASATAERAGAAADSAAAIMRDAAEAVTGTADRMATQVGDAADGLGERASDAADAMAGDPRQCAAITKAGTRCKRPAIAGSEFCSIHQIA